MIQKLILKLTLLFSIVCSAQTDYSDRWEDFFSYNTVKKIFSANNKLFALCENAVFEYDIETKKTKKISSVNGLSGGNTSAIHFYNNNNRLIIGYENGLLEIIDNNGKITVAPDIVNFNQSGLKKINTIYEYNSKLYLGTSFGIVVYDIENLEFGDTYFIGQNSSTENINNITVSEDKIYAATNKGIFVANVNDKNLIDSQNWKLISQFPSKKLVTFNNKVYADNNNNLIAFNADNSASTVKKSFSEKIIDLKSDQNNLIVALSKKMIALNEQLVPVKEIFSNGSYNFKLNNAIKKNETFFLATDKFGILAQNASNSTFTEIHPNGPLYNDTFSIDAYNKKLWVVYGGYGNVYQPLGIRKGYSYFNGNTWKNTPYDPNQPFTDLNYVTINKKSEDTVYLSSMGYSNNPNSNYSGGLIELKDNAITEIYNHNNSSIEYINSVYPDVTTIRVTGTAFDNQDNLWLVNVGATNRIHKKSISGKWKSFNISPIYNTNAFGMNEIAIDDNNTLWIGTRQNGVYVFNEKGQQKLSFSAEPSKGNLPNLTVKTVAVDKNDRVWIGTLSGLVVFENASNIFNSNIYKAEPVVILDGDIGQKLLGDQTINSIAIDGANNKWFGTDNAGALYTNADGQKTLAQFNTENSPLPSNKIVKIKVDDITGNVYFATERGIVMYRSNVSPYGNEIPEIYAYPNPALQKHNTITIDGRNGKHLPKGTNVKILDSAGNLVFESNVIEDQELFGGKVVWNKRNLAGTKVASGIYFVLLSNDDGTESSATKIAIVN